MNESGPFIAMAVLCQRYDRQPDGTVDVTGIVDGLALRAASPEHLRHEPMELQLMALVALRAGDARGVHTVTIRGRFPSGHDGPSVTQRVVFSDERPGATLRVPLELSLQEAGSYAFDILVEGRLLSRMALIVEVAFDASSSM